MPAGKNDKKEPYKTSSLDDYISAVSSASPSFAKMFPQDQMDNARKRNADFRGKYGEYAANREWWGDAYNKIIPSEKRRLGDVVLNAATKNGVNPKMLYGSAMEEGLYNSLLGEKVLNQNGTPDENYPINGMSLLGLDSFGEKYDKLKKYLPSDFQFLPQDGVNNKGIKTKTGLFKTPTDALTAMSAFLKYNRDNVENHIKENNINLSPEQKDFFTMAAYNSGEDNMKHMMQYYNTKGLLKDNEFLKNDELRNDKYGEIYRNVRRRIDPVNGLEQDGELDFSPQRTEVAQNGKESWMNGMSATQRQSGNYKVLQPQTANVPFDIAVVGNKRKVIARNADLSKVADINTLPDLDVYDLASNLKYINK